MYTSRLPMSTSVRRPTANPDGLTSFDGLNRPSNIPVTVRKVNLFTPKTKTPFQTGASTAGKSYMSGMTTEKKYQRSLKPMPDREQQIKMFDILVDYLKTNAPHLPLLEAKKFLSSVSTTESTRIFEFLIGRILQDFKINRLEIDVPEALALLEYPYIRSVTKSALVSVTTRQAAVGLLNIFYWLILSINCIENVSLDDFDDGEESIDERSQIYKNILLKPVRIREANREFFDRLYPPQDLQTKLNELSETYKEIESLELHLEEVDGVTHKIQLLDEDMAKCKIYKEQMVKYVQVKQNEEEQQKHLSLRLDIQLEELIKQEEKLLLEIQNHELDIEEVKRDQAVLEELESRAAAIRKQLNATNIEKDQLAKTLQKELERYKVSKDENLTELKKLLYNYDSHRDIESEHLNARRNEIREWILKLEQLPHDDLAQNQRLQYELSLFIQKLRATQSSLESEIRVVMSEQKKQLESLKSSNAKFSEDILPRLREAIKRVERETENERLQHMDNMSKLEAQKQEEDRKFVHMQEKHKETMTALLNEKDLALQRLRADKNEAAVMDELNMEHLKSVLDRNRKKLSSMVKEEESEVKRLEEARKISDENNRAAKKALKLFKRR